MTTKRTKLALLGALFFLASAQSASASILSVLQDILVFSETYIVPLLASLSPMPPTLDGQVLAGTQTAIGSAPHSYPVGNPPSANPLFPPAGNPEWIPPDGLSTYSSMRFADRVARADEAEAVATGVISDDLAATVRLDGYTARNAIPDESISGDIKLGNTVAVESAGTLHKIEAMQAEANQLEADQRVQEDWARKQVDLYNHTTLRNGYWAGMKSWSPDVLQ